MRIRQKMLFMELSIATAFIITIGLFFILLGNITELKNAEIQSQKVFNKLNRVNYRAVISVNNRTAFTQSYIKWNEAIIDFSVYLQDLKQSKGINLLGRELTKRIDAVSEEWSDMRSEIIADFDIRIKIASVNNIKAKVGNYTLSYANSYNELHTLLNDEEILILSDLIDSQQSLFVQLQDYTILMSSLISGIQSEINFRINFTLILIAILFTFIIIAALLAAFIFAGGLSRNVKLIESTAKLVTSGNFNIKLNIQTKDEFKTLSDNFNIFTEMLWSRLDAVRTIMRDMAEINDEIEDLEIVEREILNLAIKNSSADAGAIFLYDNENDLLRPAFVKGDFPPPYPVSASITQNAERAYKFFNEKSIALGENIIGKVASSGEAVFIKKATETKDLPSRWSNDPLHISSFMAIPLLVSNKVLGVFALAKTDPYTFFSDLSFTNMKTFGEYTALSIDNRYKYTELKEKFELSRELSIATEIQQGLTLRKVPKIKNLMISSFHNAAKGISGDYFDVFQISQSKTAVVVCDVAGKGIPAALVMVMIRTILRVIAHPERDAGTMLTMLNSNISGKVGSDQYATMGIMIIDTNSGDLTFSNAANLPLHIYRKENKRFANFNSESLPVGVEMETIYPQQNIKLNQGDIAAICTDGITEAQNIHGQEFSMKTLLREIKKYADKDTDEITEIIGNEMEIFLRGSYLYDDQSLLLMKYEG